ncbi:MAG TPA: DUF1538 domain-containing protein [Hyphomicrobiaceae bacterium]
MELNGTFLDHIAETAFSIAVAIVPLAALFIAFQIFMLRLPRREVRDILLGTVLAAAGLFLFLLGVGIGFLPFGRAIGEAVGAVQNLWLLIGIGLFLGFVTTWGEPAVRILAEQVDEASQGAIPGILVLYAVCLGVAVWVMLGLLRIKYGIPILYLLLPGYIIAVLTIWLSSRDFVAIAIDAGGVATGPLANTFLLALALGASSAMDDQSPVTHGLGLVALIAVAPIISVTILGLLIGRKGAKE